MLLWNGAVHGVCRSHGACLHLLDMKDLFDVRPVSEVKDGAPLIAAKIGGLRPISCVRLNQTAKTAFIQEKCVIKFPDASLRES